jgi:hypothetical protein
MLKSDARSAKYSLTHLLWICSISHHMSHFDFNKVWKIAHPILSEVKLPSCHCSVLFIAVCCEQPLTWVMYKSCFRTWAFRSNEWNFTFLDAPCCPAVPRQAALSPQETRVPCSTQSALLGIARLSFLRYFYGLCWWGKHLFVVISHSNFSFSGLLLFFCQFSLRVTVFLEILHIQIISFLVYFVFSVCLWWFYVMSLFVLFHWFLFLGC